MKTIALVTNTTWNIYNFRQNLIDKFIAEGYEVVVVAPVDEYIYYKEKYPSVRHFNIRMLSRDGMNPIKDFLLILELIRRYRKLKPDVVIHFTNKPNIYGALAAMIVGVKSIAVVTGLGHAYIRNGFVRQVMHWLYKRTGNYNQKIIFENEDDKDLFVHSDIIPLSKAVAVKGCGVDTDYFSPIKKESGNGSVVFTFIGRLLYDKGIREFVAAATKIQEKYKNTQFWIVGELDDDNPSTVDRDELVQWVEKGIVVYHGFLKDIRKVIGASDCIVLPSYREGLPRVNIEAMSMAKPIITTDTAGCRETVDDGVNGFIVKTQNVESLTEGIEKMFLLSDKTRLEMGRAGRRKAEALFTDSIIAEDILEIVKTVTD